MMLYLSKWQSILLHTSQMAYSCMEKVSQCATHPCVFVGVVTHPGMCLCVCRRCDSSRRVLTSSAATGGCPRPCLPWSWLRWWHKRCGARTPTSNSCPTSLGTSSRGARTRWVVWSGVEHWESCGALWVVWSSVSCVEQRGLCGAVWVMWSSVGRMEQWVLWSSVGHVEQYGAVWLVWSSMEQCESCGAVWSSMEEQCVVWVMWSSVEHCE